MSLPDRKARIFRRGLVLSACLGAMMLGSACTVRPLYSDATAFGGTSAQDAAGLSSVVVKPVKTRYAQEVRNHLIFLFNGGAGQPANPEYSMDLGVTVIDSRTALIQTVKEDRPTAGTIIMKSFYVIKKFGTGETVAQGTREFSSSYDKPRQEFAALRAQRDAENRAARELAELLRLAVAQDLNRAARQ
ncbi:MAG: hypothetical protein H0T56_05120 [Pseudaminobacter sp.]|nr:hypothetical protein [Pseudaminobacter sp.]